MSPTPDWWERCIEHREFVRRLALGLVRDPHAAEDLTQDALLIAVSRPPGRLDSPRGWLATVVRRLASDRRRSDARRRERETRAARADEAPTERFQERLQVQRVLLDSLEDLPEAYGSVLYLHYYEELSYREIAERTGTPLETVRTRAKRGLARLRDRLDRAHGGDRRAWSLALLALGPPATRASSSTPLALKLGVLAAPLTLAAGWVLVERVTPPAEVLAAVPATVAPEENDEVRPRPTAPERRLALEEPATTPAVEDDRSGSTEGPTGLAVSGRALLPDGAPAAGAAIWVSSAEVPHLGELATECDERGRFALEDVDPRAWIAAAHAGHGFSERRALEPWALRGELEASLELTLLSPGPLLRGVVVDERGTPLPGAVLRERPLEAESLRFGLDGGVYLGPPEQVAVADEDGALALVSRAQSWLASAPGRATTVVEDLVSDTPNTIVLEPEAGLAGTLLAPTGLPLVGARVEVRVADSGGPWTTATDARGGFRLGGLPGGRATVRAFTEEGLGLGAGDELALRTGEHTRWDPELSAASSIAGRARGADGAPLVGWRIGLFEEEAIAGDREGSPFAGPERRTVLTGPTGEFAFGGCREVPHVLTLSAPEAPVPVSWRWDVRPDGDTLELEVGGASEASPGIEGHLLGEGGEALRGALVMVYSKVLGRRLFARVGTDGAFRLGPLPPGRYKLEGWADGRTPAQLLAVRVESGRTLDVGLLELPTAGALRLLTRSSDGEPQLVAATLMSRRGPFWGGSWESTRLAPGALLFDPLPSDEYAVLVHGHGLALRTVDTVVRPGEETLLELELEPGTPVSLEFQPPRNPRTSSAFYYRILDATGAEVAWNVTRWLEDRPLSVEVHLSLGDFTVEARTVGGRIGTASFSVRELSGLSFPVRIPLE